MSLPQAVNWTGSKVVGGLSSIDEALENAEVLRKLDPEDPLDSDAQLTNECSEVGQPELEPAHDRALVLFQPCMLHTWL